MEGETLTVRLLTYKPNIYEFLYNISCQISETMLFTDVAPIVVKDALCFLIYKHVDVSKFEAYRTINNILNYNINNFSNRFSVDLEQHFEEDFKLLKVRLMEDYYFTFAVNKSVAFAEGGVFKSHCI